MEDFVINVLHGEHLYELARSLYGEGTPEAHHWLQPLLRFLEHRKDGALDVLHELEDLRQRLKNLTASQQEALGKEIGYFTTHRQRMDYKQGKANGEPVGSGVVESTARQYQTRFKCTGPGGGTGSYTCLAIQRATVSRDVTLAAN